MTHGVTFVTPERSDRLTYTMAAAESEDYLAVLKASYDYEPSGEDEIAIKEDQILFLLERTDEE